MKQGRRTAAVAIAAAVWAGVATSAARADLPAAVRQSATAETASAEIGKYVKGLVDLVMAGDKKSAAARDELGRQTEPTPTVTPSGSFDTVYVTAVVNSLQPVLGGKNVVQRLNAALIIQRLTVSTHLTQLQPVIEQLMKDDSPAVALKGVQSAAALLPWILNNPLNLKTQKLTSTVLDSAKKHATSGPLVQDAYGALYLPDPPLPTAAYGPCIDAMNKLVAMRSTEYATTMPSYPQADRIPTGFFTRSIVQGAMTPKQKTETVQQLLNLLSVSAARAASATGADRKEQVKVPEACASVLYVLLTQSQPGVAKQFQDLARLLGASPADQIGRAIADATTALQAVPEYKGVTAPAPVPSAPVPSAPAPSAAAAVSPAAG